MFKSLARPDSYQGFGVQKQLKLNKPIIKFA